LIKVEPFDQNERVLDKLLQSKPMSFNGFCNCGFGLGGFPLLGDKSMHSPPFDFGGTIHTP
jgi:hypothetical protein